MSVMKAKYLKLILLVVMILPSAMSNAQSQVVTNAGSLDEALKFLYDNMVYVEEGTYLKGESQVSTIVGSFYCCRYETLYWLWRHVMEQPEDEDMGDMAPIIGPTWTMFQQFIEKLDQYAGIKYRLLTDDEWEYAARGGKLSKGYLYAGSNNIDDVAWYEDNWGTQPLIVGRKQPNELGLYDMSGNADEWCQDTVPSASNARRRTPIPDADLPDEAPDFGKHRYVRGGGFLSSAKGCTVYAHYGQPSDWGWPTIGCRLALDVDEYNKLKPSKFRISMKTGESDLEIACEAGYIQYNPQTRKFIIPSPDEAGGGIATELDIAQVDYISRAPISTVQLPEGANVDMSDIVVIGSGKRQEIDENGCFESDGGNLVAMNKDNIVYLSYGCSIEKTTLDAYETAMSILLPLLPFSVSDIEDNKLYVLKRMIGYLEETKSLAEAIDQSVMQKGYLDMESVMPQYDAAVKAIMSRLGIDSKHLAKIANKRRVPNLPYFSVTSTNEVQGDGFRLILESSSWENGNEGNFWKCGFTLYNSNCKCYTTLTKCYRNPNDGLYYRINDEIYDTFKYLVKPMNVSEFMDWGTLSDLVTNPEDFLNTLTQPDFDKLMTFLWESVKPLGNFFGGDYDYFTEATWDKVKVSGISFDFYHSDENLMIAGPGIDGNLYLFNFLKIAFQPAMKFLIGKINKDKRTEELDIEDDLILEFVEWMANADLQFRAKLLAKIQDPSISWFDKLSVLSDVSDKFKEYIMDEAYGLVSKRIYKKTIKAALDEADVNEIEAIFKLYKSILSAGNFLLWTLDSTYDGVGFDLRLDFNQPGATLPDAPGEDL